MFLLLECFGDKIIKTNISGKPNVAIFRTTATAILWEFHRFREHQEDLDNSEEQMNIIKTAAKLIKNDLRSIPASEQRYV